MRDTEHLYQKIMEELDLSREIEDEALMELIYTVLSEERREHYMSLQEMNMLGKTGFSKAVDLAFYMISNGWINPLY